MFARRTGRVCLALSLLTAAGSNGAGLQPPKGEKLVVYGPTSPAPAITEAATAFSARAGVTVDVRSGPAETWLDQAAEDADLVYTTAEFMMSRFLRTPALRLDPQTVTGLYVRPSVILVRPSNPKAIRDFPDLLQPDVSIMVVEGSGQTGLWEDMGGKLGSVAQLRALRRNIVLFAPTSDDAVKAWRTREDIDAWITWNIWYMPLRDQAKLVPVSREFRIYRQCSIASTERAKAKPAAQRFVDFLASKEGGQIFESWGWMAPSNGNRPLAIDTDVCAVCRIDVDDWKDGYGVGLLDLKTLVADYERMGIPAAEVHLSAVLHGDAAYWALNDATYARVKAGRSPNPNRSLIEDLQSLGVSLEVCSKSMERNGWTADDLLPGIRLVPSAHTRIIDLQQQGYAYLRF